MLTPCISSFSSNSFRKEKVKDTVSNYTVKSEFEKLLLEATSNEGPALSLEKLELLLECSYKE
jgi:hypothetical protein